MIKRLLACPACGAETIPVGDGHSAAMLCPAGHRTPCPECMVDLHGGYFTVPQAVRVHVQQRNVGKHAAGEIAGDGRGQGRTPCRVHGCHRVYEWRLDWRRSRGGRVTVEFRPTVRPAERE